MSSTKAMIPRTASDVLRFQEPALCAKYDGSRCEMIPVLYGVGALSLAPLDSCATPLHTRKPSGLNIGVSVRNFKGLVSMQNPAPYAASALPTSLILRHLNPRWVTGPRTQLAEYVL